MDISSLVPATEDMFWEDENGELEEEFVIERNMIRERYEINRAVLKALVQGPFADTEQEIIENLFL